MTARKFTPLVCSLLFLASHLLINSAFAVVDLVDIAITSDAGGGIPDLRVGNKSNPSSHKGNNNYRKVSLKEGDIGNSTSFYVSLENDGTAADTFSMRSRSSRDFKVSHKVVGGGNITGALTSGRHSTSLGVGRVHNIKSSIKPKRRSFKAQTYNDVITANADTGGGNDKANIKLKFRPISKPTDLTSP